MRPSVSDIEVLLATDLDLRRAGWTYETGFGPAWDHERIFHENALGEAGLVGVRIPSLLDPGLAPPGEHVMIVTALMRQTVKCSSRAEEARYQERVIARLQRHLPEIRGHIRHAEVLAPHRRARLVSSRDGAVLGWELTPDQVGPYRLPQRTPIGRLYLASHWTRPAAGICGTTMTGVQVAQHILGHRNPGRLLSASRNGQRRPRERTAPPGPEGT